MDLLKTILLYLSMLYVSSVQVAPDPSTVNVTPTPIPTPYGYYDTAIPVATPKPTPVPTPAITANPAYKQLVMGDRNATVGDVQRRLQELGYYLGDIDSAYGNQTRRAVEQFQYRNGLTVDGIAGKYTQTILFESDDAVPAPVVTSTPAFQPDEIVTPPPATATPVLTAAPTATPAPEATATAEPADTPAPTAEADIAAPMLMEEYAFVLAGFSEPLTLQGTDTVLHPVESDETLYVPLTEIIRDAGNVIIENTADGLGEIAFSVLTDLYQVSYVQNEDGSLSDLAVKKNAQTQPMTMRGAILMDGVVYLPLEDMARITGIEFTMDEAAGIITVTMPSAG